MLSFFPRGVLDEILNLIESVSEGFPSYSSTFHMLWPRWSGPLTPFVPTVTRLWETFTLFVGLVMNLKNLYSLTLHKRQVDTGIVQPPLYVEAQLKVVGNETTVHLRMTMFPIPVLIKGGKV